MRGCSIGDREKLSIINKAESCIPPVSVEIYVENSKRIPFYRIEIASGENKPYCSSGGTYKIRGDGRTEALTPSRLLNMFLKSENQEFVERYREATSDLETRLQDTKSKIIIEISSLLPIIHEMEDKIEYILGYIFGSAQNAEANAEEANVFSDETLYAVQELRGKLEEIDDYVLTGIDKKLDALLGHLGLEDPRTKAARLQVEFITKESHQKGISEKEIAQTLSNLWHNQQFYAAWSDVNKWYKETIDEFKKRSKKDNSNKDTKENKQ